MMEQTLRETLFVVGGVALGWIMRMWWDEIKGWLIVSTEEECEAEEAAEAQADNEAAEEKGMKAMAAISIEKEDE